MSSLVGTASSGKKKLTRVAIADDDAQFIEFDATIVAAHDGTATITKHPVESGANVTDHIRREPETLNLEVIVSDTPLIFVASINARPSVPGGNPVTRAVDAYEFIKRIKDQGKTVTVSTRLRDYPSMAIASVGVTQDKDTGNIVRFRIGLEEITIAETGTKPIPEPVNASRTPSDDLGKQNKTPSPTEAESEVTRVSVLRGLLGG